MLATFLEAKQSGAINDIAGSCPNGEKFRNLLNEATSRLMRRGDWDGTIVPIYVCVNANCIVFPRYVAEVRKLKLCNRTIPIQNSFYDFNVFGNNWRQCWSSWWQGDARMIGSTRSPVYQDVQGEGRLIRAYPRLNSDAGKTLTIFGIDNNGQTLRHLDEIQNWQDGKIITLEKPFGSTDVYVRSIDRVLKDRTQGVVDVYAYNAATDKLEDIAHYDPSETNPAYAKYQLHAGCCSISRSIVALVKLTYVPVQDDTDLVLVENLDSLADMMQSLKLKKAGDIQGSTNYEASAVRELNLDLWSKDGEDAVTVHNSPLADIYTGPRVF